MIVKSGTTICQCGEKINWKTFFISKGAVVTFKYEDVQKNVVDKNESNNQFFVTVRCPKCLRRTILTIDK